MIYLEKLQHASLLSYGFEARFIRRFKYKISPLRQAVLYYNSTNTSLKVMPGITLKFEHCTRMLSRFVKKHQI